MDAWLVRPTQPLLDWPVEWLLSSSFAFSPSHPAINPSTNQSINDPHHQHHHHQFEAKAFQGPYDREPQLMFYKGYVKRGLVNSKQVRIEGKIYDVKGTFL
jgi:hypothetical protein